MYKLLLVVIFTVFSGLSHAEKVYKCVGADGSQTFQQIPCTSQQGVSEQIEIKTQSIAAPPSSPRSSVHSNYLERSMQQREVETRQRMADKAQQDYIESQNKIMDNYNKKKCERYKGYVQDVQNRWDLVKRDGYKQSEKDRYKLRIKKAERDMQRECAY